MNYQRDNYALLINKLDEFIRKFYKNMLIRGSIYFIAVFLVFFLSFSLLEYFGHFNVTVRTLLFYLFLLTNGFILFRWIIRPLLKLNKLGETLSYEQAAEIIGHHFSGIKDKLINTLQLHKEAEERFEVQSRELILASINQKILEIKPVPFTSAVNFSENKKYLKYAVVPLIFFLGIIFSSPRVITESTARLIDHRTFYEEPAPFNFNILNKKLEAVQQQDFELKVQIKGKVIPDVVYVQTEQGKFRLEKESRISFSYIFKNVQKNIPFQLEGDGYLSKQYTIEALPNPVVLNFEIQLEYPKYIGKTDETITNTGDLLIPEGTKVKWNFHTQNTEQLKFSLSDTSFLLHQSDANRYSLTKRFTKSTNYSIVASNKYLLNRDSIIYAIAVVQDQYPVISVEEQKDTLSDKRYYFKGIVKDDYGFSRLLFRYRKNPEDNKKQSVTESVNISVTKSNSSDQFYHFVDFSSMDIQPGESIEYYFEVFDNDGVNGSKSTRSQIHVFKAPSLQEMAENNERSNTEIKKDIKESISEIRKLQKDINDFSRKLFEKKDLSWEDKKKANDLVNRQKELEKKLDNIRNENERKQSQNQELNPELLEKQKMLDNLFENLMSDEMKKLMQELQKMLEKADKNQLQEQLEKMKFSNKDIEKELDRSLELFKQMEFSQKMEESIKNLEKLAEKQERLSKESLDKKADNSELQKKQEELKKEFENVKKELSEMEKKNESLEFKNDFKNPEEEQKAIDKDMNDSKQQLGENKNKKASQSQKNAAEKMQQMSKKLQEMQESAEMSAMEDNLGDLRAILENLLKLSFGQEQLMQDVQKTDINNPRYLRISQNQKKLREDAKMIEDSLFVLSKKVAQIQGIINQEISQINQNMDKALENLEERAVWNAKSRQQYVMTSVNNLALLLSEIMQSMQQQMAQAQQKKMNGGNSSCKKPGGAKPSVGNLRKMQEQLNQQMKEMKEGMGKQGKEGSKGMSEQLAKMAAQQEAIRNELNKLNQKENKDGKGSLGNLDKIAKQMEQTETDLVNKLLSQETLKRQQEILTRLLESEKSEKEREMDNKRESNEGKSLVNRNPAQFEEYKRQKQKEMELLRTVPPSLLPFYKKKVNEYFQNIENQ